MATDKHQQLINFIGQRILAVDVGPSFLGHQATVKVGLLAPDGTVSWFEDAESLGTALADDVGFRAMELGTWLNSPDGTLIAEAVGQVLSPVFRPEYQLVVDGLKFAASHQRATGWQRAMGVAVLTTLFGFGLWLSRGD